MVEALKAISLEIGRTPTREQFLQKSKYNRYNIEAVFGGYVYFLEAAGKRSVNHKKVDKQEIREKVFEKLKKDVEEKKSGLYPPKITHRLLCISDMHHPYGHPDTVKFLTDLHEKYNFDTILIGGDEVDSHAMSFHDHNPDLLSPGHELQAAIKSLQPLYTLFPEAKVLSSNHGDLFYRKGKHHGFPRHVLKDYNEVIEAPSTWEWAEEHIFQFPNGQKAIAHHGYSSNILMASKKRAMSLIQFHFHSTFSIQFWKNREALFFALQCGSLVDDTSLAMEYNKLVLERPILGVGAVIDGIPRLFPMLLNVMGRWNGVVP